MIFDRENKIINVLLTICLALGFVCFALIVFPEQLKKVKISYNPSQLPESSSLSSIVSLEKDVVEEKSPKPKELIKFIPEQISQTPPADIEPVSDEVAGGAGAAIDDTSAEARQAYAFAPSPVSNEGQTHLPLLPKTETEKLIQARSLPMSSLASGTVSALDGNLKKLKKEWLAPPEDLESHFAFWRDVYSKYDRNQVVLHHPKHLNIIYDVVDLTDIDKDERLNDIEKAHTREKRVEKRREEITAILTKLAGNPQASSLSDAEWTIKKLFQEILDEPDKFKHAAEKDGVRAQLGQKDKFIIGLKNSGKYLGEIESIFDSYGLPRELTRLIFVESMFNPYAVSSVGASGIWQFMRGTGRLYLEINDLVDERNDPILSTHAAAKLLRQNYDALGSWPLALNAYNAGRRRMEQAVARLGTKDIGIIIKNFDHPAYGFASRNFFLEFLAALEVAEHGERYFGKIEYDSPLKFETVNLNYNISLPDVARTAGMNIDALISLNPALSPQIESGQKLLPIGFTIRVPERGGEVFLTAAARSPNSNIRSVTHKVGDGETIEIVAKMYKVTPAAILKSNDNISRNLHAGQKIYVPVNKP